MHQKASFCEQFYYHLALKILCLWIFTAFMQQLSVGIAYLLTYLQYLLL